MSVATLSGREARVDNDDFTTTTNRTLPKVMPDELEVLARGRCVGLRLNWWTTPNRQVGPRRPTNPSTWKRAIAECNACPVREQCLEVGLRVDVEAVVRSGFCEAGVVGIWGGKTPGERLDILHERGLI